MHDRGDLAKNTGSSLSWIGFVRRLLLRAAGREHLAGVQLVVRRRGQQVVGIFDRRLDRDLVDVERERRGVELRVLEVVRDLIEPRRHACGTASISSRISAGIAHRPAHRPSASAPRWRPAMSSTRLPSTRPTRVFPAASNVASLNGVSGLLESAARCAPTGGGQQDRQDEQTQSAHGQLLERRNHSAGGPAGSAKAFALHIFVARRHVAVARRL